jgi:hypothetical protein
MVKDMSVADACADAHKKPSTSKSKDGALAGGIIGGLMAIVVLLFVYTRYFRTRTQHYQAI